MQVNGDAQVVGPVNPVPPHWPYWVCRGPAGWVLVMLTGWPEVVGPTVVVGGGVGFAEELPLDGGGGGGAAAPLPMAVVMGPFSM